MLSDVIGDIGVDESPQNIDDEKVKGLAEKSVHEITVSECKKLWYLFHNVVGKYHIVGIIVRESVLPKDPSATGDKVWIFFKQKSTANRCKKSRITKRVLIEEEKKNEKNQQGRKNYFSENDDIKNMSMSLSNFIDTKPIGNFWLKPEGK